jgi:hypothetical protein
MRGITMDKTRRFFGLLSACVLGAFAFAGIVDRASAASTTLIAQRALAQQGLAIGLLGLTFQADVVLFNALTGTTVGDCTALDGNGSSKLISKSGAAKVNLTVAIYYDGACQDLYARMQGTATKLAPQNYDFKATAVLHGRTGTTLGTQIVNGNFKTTSTTTLQIWGTGTYTPVGTAVPLHLGFTCTLPKSASDPAPCQYGVAQQFKRLKMDVASITKLNLSLSINTDATFKVAFAGNNAKVVTGSPNTLKITAPTDTTLRVAGGSTPFSTSDVRGRMGNFAPLPNRPTSWTATDDTNNAEFSIAIQAGAAHSYSGQIGRVTTSAVLATFTIDKSGNGAITYSDGSTAKINSWVLAD